MLILKIFIVVACMILLTAFYFVGYLDGWRKAKKSEKQKGDILNYSNDRSGC
jgi:hypothetical protein